MKRLMVVVMVLGFSLQAYGATFTVNDFKYMNTVGPLILKMSEHMGMVAEEDVLTAIIEQRKCEVFTLLQQENTMAVKIIEPLKVDAFIHVKELNLEALDKQIKAFGLTYTSCQTLDVELAKRASDLLNEASELWAQAAFESKLLSIEGGINH